MEAHEIIIKPLLTEKSYAGIQNKVYTFVVSKNAGKVEIKKAVEKALSMMTRGDVTVIAGKGAEKYQEIKGVKYPYNDREYVLKLIGGEI